MDKPDIWYVAYGLDKSVKPETRGSRVIRSTKTFKSESDAKTFAMEILAKGRTATAGTLNPHQPKRIISASQVEAWANPDFLE
jgi:hypothetical protein